MSIKFTVSFEIAHFPLANLTVIVGAFQFMFMTSVLDVKKAFVSPEYAISDSCSCWGELQNNALECASCFLGVKILFILMQLTVLHSMPC